MLEEIVVGSGVEVDLRLITTGSIVVEERVSSVRALHFSATRLHEM